MTRESRECGHKNEDGGGWRGCPRASLVSLIVCTYMQHVSPVASYTSMHYGPHVHVVLRYQGTTHVAAGSDVRTALRPVASRRKLHCATRLSSWQEFAPHLRHHRIIRIHELVQGASGRGATLPGMACFECPLHGDLRTVRVTKRCPIIRSTIGQ